MKPKTAKHTKKRGFKATESKSAVTSRTKGPEFEPLQPGVAATIHRWSISLGKNEKTLQTLFTRAGRPLPEKGALVPAADVFYVLFGDEQAEKVRGRKLVNDEHERKVKEDDGRLVDVDMLKAWCVQWFGGVRQAIDAAPDAVSKEWANKVFVPAVMKVAEDIAKLPRAKTDK